jgi:hypothetical protein
VRVLQAAAVLVVAGQVLPAYSQQIKAGCSYYDSSSVSDDFIPCVATSTKDGWRFALKGRTVMISVAAHARNWQRGSIDGKPATFFSEKHNVVKGVTDELGVQFEYDFTPEGIALAKASSANVKVGLPTAFHGHWGRDKLECDLEVGGFFIDRKSWGERESWGCEVIDVKVGRTELVATGKCNLQESAGHRGRAIRRLKLTYAGTRLTAINSHPAVLCSRPASGQPAPSATPEPARSTEPGPGTSPPTRGRAPAAPAGPDAVARFIQGR